MLDYLGSLPMWLQVAIVLIGLLMVIVFFAVIVKLSMVVIYKIKNAERIKAGPTGIEIEDDPEEPEKVIEEPPKRKGRK